MSSDQKPTTRDRILQATLDFVETNPGREVSMGAIAKAAGLSRQAVYLTFSDKADLFIALVRFVDDRRGLSAEIAKVTGAPNGLAALDELVSLQARMNPALYPAVIALEALRRTDAAVEDGWRDRLDNRLRGCRGIAERLEAEGRLKAGLGVAEAADLIWTLTSLRQWEDLVILRGWSAERYEARVGALLRAAVTTAA